MEGAGVVDARLRGRADRPSSLQLALAAVVLAIKSLVLVGVHAKYHKTVFIFLSGALGLLLTVVACGRMVLMPIF
jgi:hypothetical protein